jgi:hypothetical protein
MADLFYMNVTPVNDLVDHDEDSSCVCIPEVTVLEDRVIVIHHSLDGRELVERG